MKLGSSTINRKTSPCLFVECVLRFICYFSISEFRYIACSFKIIRSVMYKVNVSDTFVSTNEGGSPDDDLLKRLKHVG